MLDINVIRQAFEQAGLIAVINPDDEQMIEITTGTTNYHLIGLTVLEDGLRFEGVQDSEHYDLPIVNEDTLDELVRTYIRCDEDGLEALFS